MGPASGQAARRLRPLRRRDARIARPARVRIRRRKPCVLCRRRLFGWNVRLLTSLSGVGLRTRMFSDQVRAICCKCNQREFRLAPPTRGESPIPTRVSGSWRLSVNMRHRSTPVRPDKGTRSGQRGQTDVRRSPLGGEPAHLSRGRGPGAGATPMISRNHHKKLSDCLRSPVDNRLIHRSNGC